MHFMPLIRIYFVLFSQAVQNGPDTMQATYPDIFHQLLTFITFGVAAPKYGDLEARSFGVVRGPQVDVCT